MSVTMIQDLRWGDTGKGKISEYLSSPDECDVSVRAVGGGNAGHVIQVGTRKLALHILPAGCVHPGVDLVLGRGMVTHLPTLFADANNVQEAFQSDPLSRLVIARENHILFNGHKAADAAVEKRKGKDAVGTTGSGIGPAYADKALRVGMRMEELHKTHAVLKDRYREMLKHWDCTYGVQLSSDQEEEDIVGLTSAKELLEGKVKHMTPYWQTQFSNHARIVIEGAQGSLLSIDNSGYPYVTSSPTTVAGHLQGAGIPVQELSEVIGTLKAYDTRVGNGPMRTELLEEHAARIREKGGERGSTTGRNRRIGWLDLADTKKQAWKEGVTSLAVLKGDIFDGESDIRLALDPTQGEADYLLIPGWEKPIQGLRNFEEFPQRAQYFYKRIAEYTNIPVHFIGTGPEHNDLVDRRPKR